MSVEVAVKVCEEAMDKEHVQFCDISFLYNFYIYKDLRIASDCIDSDLLWAKPLRGAKPTDPSKY